MVNVIIGLTRYSEVNPSPLTEGVAVARAEVAASQLFVPGATPSQDAICGAVRALCANAREAIQVWDLVLIRLAELQAAADGFPVASINERAA